jgi:glycosyltransferase involved in cell wall biosynthesis
MKLSLIILTYNQPGALALILKSIALQTVLPDEVLIADDGSGDETRILIRTWQEHFPVPLLHVWHEDRGCRASAIRNQAIKKSTGDFLIFSDGDLFFHPRFIEDFRKNISDKTALIGSRVFLTKSASRRRISKNRIRPVFPFLSPEIELNRLNSIRFPLLNHWLKPVQFSVRLRGGLSGVWRKDLEAVNGWNEEFTGWGLEDTEFVARLFHAGISFKKIKFQAITFHLWHEQQTRDLLPQNQLLMEETITGKWVQCRKGLVSLK